MKNCPLYKCRECNTQGHSESHCPTVLCYACKKHGHKSFSCPEKDKSQNVDSDRNDVNLKEPKAADIVHTVSPAQNPVEASIINPVPNTPQNGKTASTQSKSPIDVSHEDCAMDVSTSKLSSTDITAKRNLSCDESEEDKECSQGFECISDSQTVPRQKKHITPNLMMARKFTPNHLLDHHGDASAST